MVKRITLFVAVGAVLSVLLALSGCTLFTGDSRADSVVSVTLESKPSFGDAASMRNKVYTLHEDGTMVLTEADLEGTVLSEEVRRGETGEFKRVANIAGSSAFLDLPDDIESDVLDGSYQYIEVDFGSEQVRKGGLQAIDGAQSFRDLYDAIKHAWDAGNRGLTR